MTKFLCIILTVTLATMMSEAVTLTCQEMPGDGNGNAEKYVGNANNMEDCVRKVRLEHLGANGVTFKVKGGNCFAEYDMDGSNGHKDFKSCLITPGIKTCQQGDGNGNLEAYVGKANDMDDCVKIETPTPRWEWCNI